MIDCARWVLADAWISNGLRIRWSTIRFDARVTDSRGEWQGEQGDWYRYVGWGEWEVPRPNDYLSRPFGEETAPQMSTGAMRHELAHWLVATEEQRRLPNFGIASDDSEAEERAVTAERVLSAVIAAASRVVSLSLSSRNP